MIFGLTKSEYEFIIKTIILPLAKKGAKVWCFGSRSRGDHQPFSDLDLMIESSYDLSREIGAINEALVESNFPYKVDLIQEKDFAKSYKNNFEKEKKLISEPR